jgi:hypothetical protein
MIPSFVGLYGRLEGIIARLLAAVRGSESQMKTTGAAEFVICNYAIILTFCGADSRHGIETQLSKLPNPIFSLNHRK